MYLTAATQGLLTTMMSVKMSQKRVETANQVSCGTTQPLSALQFLMTAQMEKLGTQTWLSVCYPVRFAQSFCIGTAQSATACLKCALLTRYGTQAIAFALRSLKLASPMKDGTVASACASPLLTALEPSPTVGVLGRARLTTASVVTPEHVFQLNIGTITPANAP